MSSLAPLWVRQVPWEQALAFHPLSTGSFGTAKNLVAVEWADEQWAWRHMGQVARRMNRANRALGIPPGVLSAVRLPMNGAQLADLLNEQRRLRRHDLTEPGTMAPGGAPSADPTGGRP